MSPYEPELDRITNLLGMCLGRIEEQAFRLQREGDEYCEDQVGDVIEDEASMLHELVGSLLECAVVDAVPEQADLNLTVERAVQACLDEIDVPVVVRQRLEPRLPAVACAPGQLAFAIQRALVLAVGRLEPGGEVALVTRREHGCVLFELECIGARDDRHLAERAETLAEFVHGLQGSCRMQTTGERDRLLLAIELPIEFVADER
jgi:hypothetical protein